MIDVDRTSLGRRALFVCCVIGCVLENFNSSGARYTSARELSPSTAYISQFYFTSFILFPSKDHLTIHFFPKIKI